MATNFEADLIKAGVSQEFIDSERAKGKSGLLKGVNVDKNDYAPILSAYQATGFNPTITPQQVYSAGNIASASSAPVQVPNYADPYGLRDSFLNTPEMIAKRQAVADANQALITARQTGRAQQQAIQENPMAMNVIRGAQAVAGQQSALTEQAAAENLLATQSVYDSFANEANAKYQIAQEERAKLQDLILQTGGKAGISYGDTFESALAKATSYKENLTKEEEKKAKKEAEDANKKKLQELARSYGISTKTSKGGSMSVKQLEEALTKKAKKDADLQDEMNNLKLESARVGAVADSLNIQKLRASLSGEGSADDSKKQEAFFNDIEKQRSILEAAKKDNTSNKDAWSIAWNYMNKKYPYFSADELDNALGLGYRKAFEGK